MLAVEAGQGEVGNSVPGTKAEHVVHRQRVYTATA
jgi:hypothetical protein